MKIQGSSTPPCDAAVGRALATPPAEAVQPGAAATSGATSSRSAAPAAALLEPAMQALRSMPDFDHARVTALREALARGELPFDAGRLAGLIERFHGGPR